MVEFRDLPSYFARASFSLLLVGQARLLPNAGGKGAGLIEDLLAFPCVLRLLMPGMRRFRQSSLASLASYSLFIAAASLTSRSASSIRSLTLS